MRHQAPGVAMTRYLALLFLLLLASCGGGGGSVPAAAPMGDAPISQALGPKDAPVSASRSVVAGNYIDTDINGTAAQVYRLYRAAFNRVADAGGLGYQVGQVEVLRQS